MDLVTHAVMSASIMRTGISGKADLRTLLLGIAAGMLPDIDIFFRPLAKSTLDGMLLHRHFTHSVFVAPFAALIFTLAMTCRSNEHKEYLRIWGAMTFIYLIHIFMDYCTSYGTSLFWPFLDRRYAADIISICDPVILIACSVGLLWSFISERSEPAVLGLLCTFIWLAVGMFQHNRAMVFQNELAANRNHVIERRRVTPMIFSIRQWHAMYICNGEIIIDAIETPFLGHIRKGAGTNIKLFSPSTDKNYLFDAQMLSDLEKFSKFADGFIAIAPGHKDVICDTRYSLSAGAFKPLWGIRLQHGGPTELIGLTDSIFDIMGKTDRDSHKKSHKQRHH